MLLEKAVYKNKRVIQRKLVKDEVHGCDYCGTRINEWPNEPTRLDMTVFYQTGETKHLHYCSWACVLKHLPSIKTDYFINLPNLIFDHHSTERGKKIVKQRTGAELVRLLKKALKHF